MVGLELTVGGWFAGAVISNFVAKVRSIMENHHGLLAAAGDMLYSVEAALPRIKILVEVSERKAISNGSFTAWLRQFKDAVAEAEDLLDDFETKRIQQALRSKASSVASFAFRFIRNLVLSDGDLQRLKDVLTKLNKITGETSGTGFHDMLKLAEAEDGVTRALLPPMRPVVIGRDEEKQKLLNMILFPNVPPHSQDSAESRTGVCVPVISVVGAAGVGKTSLAQVIYNDPNVKEAFVLRGWVFASCNRSSSRLDEDIMDSFATEQQENLDRKSHSSESSLISVIQNKKFFLVLDDVQDNLHNQWGPIRSTLARGATGSVVLLTTRSKEVAISFGEAAPLTLGHLPFPVLWRVFEHHAFGNQKRASLEPFGKKVVQKLLGAPLLVEAIGRLMRERLDKGYWKKVSGSSWWLLCEDDDGDVSLPSVAIMCEHLHDHLRKCLCFCSIFPSGYIFEKNILIHMWIASFLQQHDGIGMEEIEKEWFDELFCRSFFQPTIWKNRYIMPDMIREPLCSIAGKECHAATESGEHKRRLQDYRHLAISFSDFNAHQDLRKDNKLRTILFFDGHKTIKPHQAFANILLHPSGLRVLDFCYTEAKLEKPPDFIDKFKHLRFLDLSFTGVTVLPDSLCKLHLLQVLGLRGCQFKELPRSMNQLVNLRFLYAEACTVSLIYKIGKLTNLQGLEEFPIGRKEGHKITELKNLNEISGQLCIGNLEEVASTDIVGDAELFRKRHLKKLVLRWGLATCKPITASACSMRTLAGLKPNANLEELKVQCYMGIGFPAWMTEEQYLINLQRIHLIECNQLLTLPPLGQLPSLVILIFQGLSAIEKIGCEFYGKGYRVFPRLEEMKFLDMPNWRNWSDIVELQDSQIPFPHLRKVQIKNCKVLIDMPVCCLKASLEELELSGCNAIFTCNPSSLEGLNSLVHLKIHNCLGRIYLPSRLLESLEILNLQRCEVYFQGGREHVRKLRSIVPNLDESKVVRKELLVLEVLLSEGYHYLPSCFVDNWNSEASSVS